jgi:hypothetical protein
VSRVLGSVEIWRWRDGGEGFGDFEVEEAPFLETAGEGSKGNTSGHIDASDGAKILVSSTDQLTEQGDTRLKDKRL